MLAIQVQHAQRAARCFAKSHERPAVASGRVDGHFPVRRRIDLKALRRDHIHGLQQTLGVCSCRIGWLRKPFLPRFVSSFAQVVERVLQLRIQTRRSLPEGPLDNTDRTRKLNVGGFGGHVARDFQLDVVLHVLSLPPYFAPLYPARHRQKPRRAVVATLHAELPDEQLTALFCSSRCPGDLILQAYDAAQALRDAAVPLIGGFHTPIEADCLEILLRGTQPVVVCPARGVGRMRIKRAWKLPLAQGRLLLISPFDDSEMRMTKKLAGQRNRFVVDRAAALLVVHAAPGGQTEAAARYALAQSKPVLTLPSPHNTHLVALGAQPVTVPDLTAAVHAALNPERT